jgi:hypothetical protein
LSIPTPYGSRPISHRDPSIITIGRLTSGFQMTSFHKAITFIIKERKKMIEVETTANISTYEMISPGLQPSSSQYK